jgi:hypothetical protein
VAYRKNFDDEALCKRVSASGGPQTGNLAEILGFDHGLYAVEQGGRTFSVFMTNIIETVDFGQQTRGS